MSYSRFATWRIAATIAALATFAIPSAADAHPRLKRSSPAAGDRLAVAPTALRLWFTEVPELTLTSLTLTDSAGRVVAIGAVGLDSANKFGIIAPIQQVLIPGEYTIAWRTAASDGHPTNGTIVFTVVPSAAVAPRPAAVPASQTLPSATTGPTNSVAADDTSATPMAPLQVAVRVITFLGLIVVIGVVVFRLAVLPRAAVDASLSVAISQAVATVGAVAAVLLVIAVAARLALQVEMMNARPGASAVSVIDIVGATRWGAGWLLQAVGALLAATAFVAARRWKTAWAVAAVAALVLAITPGLGGHAASSARLASLALVADAGHILGGAGWLGSLLMVVSVAVPTITRAGGEQRWQHIASVVNVFSPMALLMGGLLAATGTFAAWLHLGSISALWTTDYGSALFRKLVVLVPLAATGAYNWLRVRPALGTAQATVRLRRSATVELTIGVVVIALTAVLVAMEPPVR